MTIEEVETCDCDRTFLHDCVCSQCRERFNWSSALENLEKLYHQWAKGGARTKKIQAALDDLMEAYDKWLD